MMKAAIPGKHCKAVKNLNSQYEKYWTLEYRWDLWRRAFRQSLRCFGKMAERSRKDTTTGHWEWSVIMDRPFPVYPEGFPKEIMSNLRKNKNPT